MKMRYFTAMIVLCCALTASLPCFGSEIYHGLDVSVYQGDIDFAKVKSSGYDCVYIRSGSGESGEDPLFMEHYENAKTAGLKVGFYYYVTAENVAEGEEQATDFASFISGCEYELRPAMDYEVFSQVTQEESIQIALAFLNKMEDILNQKPVIYTDTNNVLHRWGDALNQYPLWVADYAHLAEPETYQLPETSGWSQWSGYQYTDSLEVSGISGYVDGDIFKASVFLTESGKTEISYLVQSGDTLWGIGKKYGVSVRQLAIFNDIQDLNLIYVGETLKIPTDTVYIVRTGDTLYKIASEFKSSISLIAEYNQVKDVNLIYVGESLYIPT